MVEEKKRRGVKKKRKGEREKEREADSLDSVDRLLLGRNVNGQDERKDRVTTRKERCKE